ncbi:expressed unknown protein [Seminavis robusta]|uniref:Uncharacterized protein n=1 Tax=Seminavis robusta TaxID=568900 RepID=A0A9N8EBD2_9STRA|nr:expressed unknown protein [Seminavis robusta]|eukprot:Sro876_g214520.1 n/a (100) ;mRNA; f:28483-28782
MMMSPLQSPAAARARAQRQPRTPNNKRMPSSLMDLKRESNSRKYDIGALATPARRAPLARSNTIDAVPSFCTPQRNATDTRRRELHYLWGSPGHAWQSR